MTVDDSIQRTPREDGFQQRYDSAMRLWASGRRQAAADELEALLDADPAHTEGWLWLGEMHATLSSEGERINRDAEAHREKAVAAFKQAISLDRHCAKAYQALADLYGGRDSRSATAASAERGPAKSAGSVEHTQTIVAASTYALRRLNVITLPSAHEMPEAGVLDAEFQFEPCSVASVVIHTCISNNNRQSAHGWMFESPQPDLARDRPVAELAISSTGDVSVRPGCPADYDALRERLAKSPTSVSRAADEALRVSSTAPIDVHTSEAANDAEGPTQPDRTADDDASPAGPGAMARPPQPYVRSRKLPVLAAAGTALLVLLIALAIYVDRDIYLRPMQARAPAASEPRAVAPPETPGAPAVPDTRAAADALSALASDPQAPTDASRASVAHAQASAKAPRAAAPQPRASSEAPRASAPQARASSQVPQAPAPRPPVSVDASQASARAGVPADGYQASAPERPVPASASAQPATQAAPQIPVITPEITPPKSPSAPQNAVAERPSAGVPPARAEGASGAPPLVLEEPGKVVSRERLALYSSGAERLRKEQQERCPQRNIVDREICKERVRWNHCHPYKWDQVPECAVSNFGGSFPR